MLDRAEDGCHHSEISSITYVVIKSISELNFRMVDTVSCTIIMVLASALLKAIELKNTGNIQLLIHACPFVWIGIS